MQKMIKKILKGNIFKSCLNTTKLGALYSSESKKHSTTILVVKKDKEIFMIGDGQVSQGYTVVKGDARKVRVLREGIICGFAGSVSDAFTLMENLEKELDKYHGFPLLKPCIELSKHWRSSKSQYFLIFGRHLRHLEATMIVCDNSNIIELDGAGNVLEIENVRGIGSGGLFAECRLIYFFLFF